MIYGHFFVKVGMELRGILLIFVSAMIVLSVLSLLNCRLQEFRFLLASSDLFYTEVNDKIYLAHMNSVFHDLSLNLK